MNPPEPTFDVADFFNLEGIQAQAASLRGQDIAVTAGAGSGKTRTLVARYLSLLADGQQGQGLHPRQVAAITFTEKAAREMRSRVRIYLEELRRETASTPQEQLWARLESQIDSARIGTIHGLCSEILRANPVEAGLDPQFAVLDENQAAALQAEAIETSLQQIFSLQDSAPFIEAFKIDTLRSLADFSLQHRLDLAAWLEMDDEKANPLHLLSQRLSAFLEHPEAASLVEELRSLQRSHALETDYSEKLIQQVDGLLRDWDQAWQDYQSTDFVSTASALHTLRSVGLNLTSVRKESPVKHAITELRNFYESSLGTWLKDPPDLLMEATAETILPLVRHLFRLTQREYQRLKEERQALDFDDLEGGAVSLLQNNLVRRRWQNEIHSILVDEFQDTNQRQRQIIEAISGGRPGKLFVVGDGRQSIYRFRGADVTVFQRLQQDINRQGGQLLSLDRTFRAHSGLANLLTDFLQPIMQPPVDPPPDYWISYSPLQPERAGSDPTIQAPYLEFILGKGENATEGRQAAAQALAQRLLELKDSGQIQDWQEVALLFRSTRTFPEYEDALEKAGIPYVSVAGRGFYDRPEIRDLLNILRALADPWDDLAVAGLLRSPAFGLPDSSLFHLRWSSALSLEPAKRVPRSLYTILLGTLSETSTDSLQESGLSISHADLEIARRAALFIKNLSPDVDRIPVADLLKKIVDELNLRAILATWSQVTSQNRLWRNLDKLLVDAQTSGIVQVSVFFEYLQTLRDVGAREGEAAIDAQGAVQLMSIHKAKGLEFNLVVLADAANQGSNRKSPVIFLPESGLGIKPDRPEGVPLTYRIIQTLDNEQDRAENRRLLYVAMTRAREKILISGHISQRQAGWLKELSQVASIHLDQSAVSPIQPQLVTLPGGQPIRCTISLAQPVGLPTTPPSSIPPNPNLILLNEPHLGNGVPLYKPLILPEPAVDESEGEIENFLSDETIISGLHAWHQLGEAHASAKITGNLVHRALGLWCFPGEARYQRILETACFEAGLVNPAQRASTLQHAERLLLRLRTNPLWEQVETAEERYHEVPYQLASGKPGRIDLIYRTSSLARSDGWRIIDFKTETITNQAELDKAVNRYHSQMQRYRQAITQMLASRPNQPLISSSLVFLDFQNTLIEKPIHSYR